MKKFWLWMVQKGYGFQDSDGTWLINADEYGGVRQPHTKQMLVGYMMDYLDGMKRDWIDDMTFIDGHSCSFDSLIGIDMRYNWLESKINELEGKEDK